MAEKCDLSKDISAGESLDGGPDAPLYEDLLTSAEAAEVSNPDYSAINMSTMNRGSIYTGPADNCSGCQEAKRGSKSKRSLVIIASVVIILLFSGCFGVLFHEVYDLKSKASYFDVSEKQDEKIQLLNSSFIIGLTGIEESLGDLEHRIEELNISRDLSLFSIENKLIGLVHEVNSSLMSHLNASMSGLYAFRPASSCGSLPPSSPSGYYWVMAVNGSAVRVYCDDVSLSCGGVTGEWKRVAYLDVTNSSHQCPSGLRMGNYSNKRTCVRDSDPAGCSSVNFSSATLEYSRVCGKVIAYQFGAPDAFGDSGRGSDPTIDTYYMDGVSLTHGSPRYHIWTFAAGLDEVGTRPDFNCPCTNTELASQASQPPAFVGGDYFCDTGSREQWTYRLYSEDPLWDGAGCGPLNTCCSFNNPPWFSTELPQPTTDDIEMRVCSDYRATHEDIAIEIIEIYVQ